VSAILDLAKSTRHLLTDEQVMSVVSGVTKVRP
jgi:hypothetical protein